MTPQQFRLLVVLNQILLFASYPLRPLADRLLPPELAGAAGAEESVMGGRAAGESLFDDPHYLLSLALTFATLAAAAGLLRGRRWGRTLYLACFLASLLTTALTPFYVDAGLTVAVGTLYGLTEGMILGLAYFSHLRRVFERPGAGGGGEEE